MTNVLFVCHGNICRSTMAECLFADLVKKARLEGAFTIDSAGTSDEEHGNPLHPGTRRKLKEHNIPERGHRARRMTRADYQHFDYIIGMDHYNLSGIRAITGGDPEGKVHLLLDFTSRPRDIADPWYTGDFDATYEDVRQGCEGLLQALAPGANDESLCLCPGVL